ncbi:type III PLP-dependent enzyme [Pectobacteriaceae bacterium CE90]|nr:type III PLP-dependent enzyme [Pectobacteriaceae bacterium CE90]
MHRFNYQTEFIHQNGIEKLNFDTLVQVTGTPCYIYSANQIRHDLKTLTETLPAELHYFYSLKANPNVSLIKIIRQYDIGCEVCSAAELEMALAAGATPQQIIFVGPAKSPQELRRCVALGIKAVVVESLAELRQLNDIAAEANCQQTFMLRINPDFSTEKARLVMSGKPRQFGIDESQALAELSCLHHYPHLKMVGIHIYLGTRILDAEAIASNTRNILVLAEKIQQQLSFPLQFVDIGGGLGVPYYAKEQPLDLAALGYSLAPLLAAFRQQFPQMQLMMELGRYMIARAGIFVTRVRYLKDSKGSTFAICDGGSNCHGAAAGLGSVIRKNFPVRRLSARQEGAMQTYTLSGPLCTPTDIIADTVTLPRLAVGDLIGVFNSGAYGPTASPVYFLSFGYPAEILVDGDRATQIRKPDGVAHMLNQQQPVDLEIPQP